MSNFERQEIANTDKSAPLVIEPSKTFAFVSGVGGSSAREWSDGLEQKPWWGAIGARQNNLKHGSLFCKFNLNGEMNKGYCYFKQADGGEVRDSFMIESKNPASGSTGCIETIKLQV